MPTVAIKTDANGIPTINGSIPLSFLGFTLLMNCGFVLMAIVSDGSTAWRGTFESGELLPDDYRLFVGTMTAIHALFAAALIFGMVRFFGRHRTAPRLLLSLFLGAIVLNSLQAVWMIALCKGSADCVAEVLPSAVFQCLVALAWVIYLVRSERGRATFQYPLPSVVSQGATAG